LASTLPLQAETYVSSPKYNVMRQDDNDDDEILLAARQVRQAMAESMTLFQDEIAKDGTGKSESTQTNVATTKNMGAQEPVNSLRSTTSTSLGGRASRFVEPPPKYRNRVSKFLPRERYADIQVRRRGTANAAPRTTPLASRRSETLSRAVAQVSTADEQKASDKTDHVIDLDDDDERETLTNGWHQNDQESSPAEVIQFKTMDPMPATYVSPAMYAPLQYDPQPTPPYNAQPALQEPSQGHGDPDFERHVDQVSATTTFSPSNPNLHVNAWSTLAHQAGQFVPQQHRSPSIEPVNIVSTRYPTPPPPPSAIDEEVTVLHVTKHTPKHQPVPSAPRRSSSPVRQTRPAPKEMAKQRQVSQPKRSHHRQPSAPHVNPFALLAGMDDEDGESGADDEDDESNADNEEGAKDFVGGDDAVGEGPESEAEEEEDEFVDEQGGQSVNAQDNGYDEEDDGQYDEEHGFNDDSDLGNGQYSAEDDVEEEGEGEGNYDEEEEEEDESVEDDDDEEPAPPPPPAWDGKGGSAEDAIEL